jgi:hypothetical protein
MSGAWPPFGSLRTRRRPWRKCDRRCVQLTHGAHHRPRGTECLCVHMRASVHVRGSRTHAEAHAAAPDDIGRRGVQGRPRDRDAPAAVPHAKVHARLRLCGRWLRGGGGGGGCGGDVRTPPLPPEARRRDAPSLYGTEGGGSMILSPCFIASQRRWLWVPSSRLDALCTRRRRQWRWWWWWGGGGETRVHVVVDKRAQVASRDIACCRSQRASQQQSWADGRRDGRRDGREQHASDGTEATSRTLASPRYTALSHHTHAFPRSTAVSQCSPIALPPPHVSVTICPPPSRACHTRAQPTHASALAASAALRASASTISASALMPREASTLPLTATPPVALLPLVDAAGAGAAAGAPAPAAPLPAAPMAAATASRTAARHAARQRDAKMPFLTRSSDERPRAAAVGCHVQARERGVGGEMHAAAVAGPPPPQPPPSTHPRRLGGVDVVEAPQQVGAVRRPFFQHFDRAARQLGHLRRRQHHLLERAQAAAPRVKRRLQGPHPAGRGGLRLEGSLQQRVARCHTAQFERHCLHVCIREGLADGCPAIRRLRATRV